MADEKVEMPLGPPRSPRGRPRTGKNRLETPDELRRYAAWTVRSVRNGRLDSKRGAVVCQLLGLLVKLWEMMDADIRIRDVEHLVSQMNARLDQQQR